MLARLNAPFIPRGALSPQCMARLPSHGLPACASQARATSEQIFRARDPRERAQPEGSAKARRVT